MNMRPFTRSAGNPMMHARAPVTRLPAIIAGTMCHSPSTVSIPAMYAPTAKNPAWAMVTWPVRMMT